VTEQQLARMAKRRLAILRHAEEITGNVSLTCRYYGISRQVFYKWRRRYDEHGLDGLRDRSKRPQVSPNATRTEVVGKIIYLRQHYHFGPARIAMYLKRYHQVQISSSGVWRILKRLELNRLPASQRHKRHDRRWRRYEKPLPGHRVQLDVKFIQPLPGAPKAKRYYQFTGIDDCTRLQVLRIYDRCNQQTALQFLDYLLERLPFRVEVIQVERHRRAATVVTSNREPIEWLALMADPLLAQSAIDRLQPAAYELVLDGDSYWRRQKPTLNSNASPHELDDFDRQHGDRHHLGADAEDPNGGPMSLANKWAHRRGERQRGVIRYGGC
jgi:transposase